MPMVSTLLLQVRAFNTRQISNYEYCAAPAAGGSTAAAEEKPEESGRYSNTLVVRLGPFTQDFKQLHLPIS